MISYDDLKKGLASRFRGSLGNDGYLPHGRDEFWDVIMQRHDDDIPTPANGSYFKVIVSGHVVEIYEYEKPVVTGERKVEKTKIYDPETGEVVKYNAYEETYESTIDPESYDKHGKPLAKGYDPILAKKQNARYARLNLRRIITSNFDNSAKFFTLTFADGAVSDVTDIRECNQAFKFFMRKMRRKYGNFKFVRVVEFQDGNGRGAVHFHMMADLPYIHHEEIAKVWGYGFIGVNRIDQVDNLGAYMTKYMMKNFDDPRLRGEKAYSTSKGLIRPIEVHGEEAVEIIAQHLDNRKPVFENEYESEYQGHIKYKEFNMQRDEK